MARKTNEAVTGKIQGHKSIEITRKIYYEAVFEPKQNEIEVISLNEGGGRDGAETGEKRR